MPDRVSNPGPLTYDRVMVLTHLHDKQGRQGSDRTLSLVRQPFYWPGLEADVQHSQNMCPMISDENSSKT